MVSSTTLANGDYYVALIHRNIPGVDPDTRLCLDQDVYFAYLAGANTRAAEVADERRMARD